MDKIRVLFVCSHNVSRSAMAEAFLNRLGKDRFHAESAGFDPGETNPLVVEVMKEEGYDLGGRRSNSLLEYFQEGRLYDYVIYVCAVENEDRCPVFPGVRKTLHWPFPDPSKFQGTGQEKLSQTRRTRDQIKTQVEEWIRMTAPVSE
jgi:arsenate reductase (thioredoxin)